MRILYLILVFLTAGTTDGPAAETLQQVPPTASFEIVKQHTDISANADGSYILANETIFRALDARGVKALQQTNLSYTQSYQSLNVKEAYTLKADGKRIDVSPDGILYGQGATSAPGFSDVKTLSVVFPDLAVGDEIVLTTVFMQIKPWFLGQFAAGISFNPFLVVRDARISLTAPAAGFPLFVEAHGVDGGARETAGSKKSWVWTYRNDMPEKPEPGAVMDLAGTPHIAISSLSDYAAVAADYAARFDGKADATAEIKALAERLTIGLSNRRDQVRALYDWVSTNINYVNIVLGAGGLTPHEAGDVLTNRYGDCKDHVMLLKALLAAKGIGSQPALIDVGNSYELPGVATPFAFNHLITYVPEFQMYLDSTARFAPFGVLPDSDAGKPVVLVGTGEVSGTPALSADSNTIHVVETVHVHKDGSADGDTDVTATGTSAIAMRAVMSAIPPANDGDYFRAVLGPTADGRLERDDTTDLKPGYAFKAHYTIANYANLPGPGALPSALGYKPFYFIPTIAATLPPQRKHAYACASLSAEDDVTVTLPAGVDITALPKTVDEQAGGIALLNRFEQLPGNRVHEHASLRINHPADVCGAEIYNASHDALKRMITGLQAQVLYK